MNKKLFLRVGLLAILVVAVIGIVSLNSSSSVTGNAVCVGDSCEIQEDIQETEFISTNTLANHNTKEDCWVSYNGKVYDITEFLSKHKAPLEKYCGTSKEFEEAYIGKHKGAKDNILNGFEIGTLG